ncbi:MAG TPA: glycosyltransferase [Candidatus Dormibacteraeota bacterium]
MTRVLIVATDVVASRMAGPGIRCLELARQLQQNGHQVTVAAAGAADLVGEPVTLVTGATPVEMDALAQRHDAILVQGFALRAFPSLRKAKAPLIVDLYDPFPLSLLEQERLLPLRERRAHNHQVSGILDELLRAGDYFICASERQRDLWIGALTAVGRVNPLTWSADDSLRQLIGVVPFGLPASPPESTADRPPGFPAEVSSGDVVLLWGGGIYNWFDPLTLIQAIAEIAGKEPRLKLVFMAMDHPNPGVPSQMWMPERARQLATDLGVLGRSVFFNEEWVAYEKRADWLLAADCGISIHLDHAETRYAFRTRILDYLWAGLPIISTKGDVLADLVDERRLGWTVAAGEVSPLVDALSQLVADPVERRAMAERVRGVAAEMTWARAAEPLLRFCDAPESAPDHPREQFQAQAQSSNLQLRLEGPKRLALAGLRGLRREGLRPTLRKARSWWARRGLP